MPFSFKEWYETNAQSLAEKRKLKYETDPDHRRRILEHNREARRLKRAHDRENVGQVLKLSPKTHGVETTIRIGDHEMTTQLFTIGTLSKAVNRPRGTLLKWEEKGLLPETTFRDKKGYRLYTLQQVEWIKEWLTRQGKLDSSSIRSRGAPRGVVHLMRKADGTTEEVRLFRSGLLAAVLSRSVMTLYEWEHQGVIPVTPFRTERMQHRLYTTQMIEAVKSAFDNEGGGLLAADGRERFSKAVKTSWENLGVFGAKLDSALQLN